MTQPDPKRDRIQSRIAKSQNRLDRENHQLAAIPDTHASSRPRTSDKLRNLADDHPWLLVAAGTGLGLLVGALLPRRAGSKGVSRALGLASAGAELALAFSRNARDAAGEGAREGLHRIEESTAPLRRRASEVAGSASRSARTTGAHLASEAVKLATRLRK